VEVIKQYTVQKESMRMQHQHEQLTFLKARFASQNNQSANADQEGGGGGGGDESLIEWPMNSPLFRGALADSGPVDVCPPLLLILLVIIILMRVSAGARV
jgi:hypothetical protein